MTTPPTTTLQDKVCFICAHEMEMNPLFSEEEREELLGAGCEHIASDAVANILLERFETKVYRYDKPQSEYIKGAKHVLFAMSETFDFILQKSLIEALLKDSWCAGIRIVADNVSGVSFVKWSKEHPGFIQERKADRDETDGAQDDLVFPDIARVAEGADAVIVGINFINSPSGIMLLNAKTVFGVRKLFVLNGGWNGLGSNPHVLKYFQKTDSFDAMFCNDSLAKKISEANLPTAIHSRVLVTGTAALDGLELEKGPEYERTTREKLGINDKEIAFLFCGDISGGYQKIDPSISLRINEETFEKTLNAFVEVAKDYPERTLVLMVRPHPGDGNKEALLRPRANLPANLRVIPAGKDVITMQEAAYTADVVLSIISTENILAPLRGKEAIYLGYRDRGFGYDVLKKIYGEKLLPQIGGHKGLMIAESWGQMYAAIASAKRNPTPESVSSTGISSVGNILSVVLG